MRDLLHDPRRHASAAADEQPISATFADAAAEWLRFIEQDRQRKPSTVGGYSSIVRTQLLPTFGPMQLEAITSETIEPGSPSLVARSACVANRSCCSTGSSGARARSTCSPLKRYGSSPAPPGPNSTPRSTSRRRSPVCAWANCWTTRAPEVRECVSLFEDVLEGLDGGGRCRTSLTSPGITPVGASAEALRRPCDSRDSGAALRKRVRQKLDVFMGRSRGDSDRYGSNTDGMPSGHSEDQRARRAFVASPAALAQLWNNSPPEAWHDERAYDHDAHVAALQALPGS